MDEIAKVGPAEILMNPALYKAEGVVKTLEARSGAMVSLYPAAAFNEKNATKRLLDQFKVYSLLSLGLEDHHSALRATGALLGYVEETQKQVLGHINHLNCYKPDEFMVLDTATRRNLELTETLRSGEKRGSLLWVLDQTVTAMGGRLLRRWVEAPLLSLPAIQDRQQRIAEFFQFSIAAAQRPAARAVSFGSRVSEMIDGATPMRASVRAKVLCGPATAISHAPINPIPPART